MSAKTVWANVCVMVMCLFASWSVGGEEAFAQQVPEGVYVPDVLEPWVPWVMAEQAHRQCARLGSDYVCDWPGEMTLSVNEVGGTFSLEVLVQRDGTLVELPGGALHWPQDVRVDGASALVLESEQKVPMVRLARGKSQITGRFEWKSAPEVLQVPGDVASVALTLDGVRVPWPRIDDSGQLWVKEASAVSVGEADTIRVSVYRHIEDDVPLSVTTMLELNVAGRAREVSLGKPLIAGGLPVSVSGALPTQIGGDGEVKVYVRPGTHEVEITSYFDAPIEKLDVPARAAEFFDPVEYWVWTPDEELRSVELGGLLTIDPSRTTLPEKWRGKTTLSAKPGSHLKLEVTRRGEPQQPPNQIAMSRSIWLDIDGEGYTFRDRLSGKMHQGWRLNYDSTHGTLGRVMDLDRSDALLITESLTDAKMRGVELRHGKIEVEAEVRLEQARNRLPAVGWAHDVQQLDATLMMPPGWSVLASQGVDEMSGTWVDSWDMFEFFVVLMIAFVMGKLFGWPWGVISALALVLSHDQPNAPRYVWFHIVAVLALLRVLPDKLWLKIPAYTYLGVSLIVLVSTFGFYAHEQIRGGLHPQIMHSYSSYDESGFLGGGMMAQEEAPESVLLEDRFSSVQMADEDNEIDIMVGGQREKNSNLDERGKASPLEISSNMPGSKSKAYAWRDLQQQVDPKEVVQTGPGLPNWSWRTWHMSWNGPVASDQEVRLWLLSPKINLLIRILGVLCFLLMGLVVLAPGVFAPRKSVKVDVYAMLRRLVMLALFASAGLASFGLVAPAEAVAQGAPAAEPSREVLQKLTDRLFEGDDCLGECAVSPSMRLEMSSSGQFVMQAEVHAQRQTGWRLPGPSTLVGMEVVQIDGEATNALRRDLMGMVYVRVPKGRHLITMRGTVNAQNVLTLQLDPSAMPHRVETKLEGWSIDGIDEFGRPDSSLQLSRQADGEVASQKALEHAQDLPPWYGVERTLLIGLPWQSRTLVTRADASRPQLVKIPLLPGEAVISEGVRVEQGVALINFERGVTRYDYMSEIALPTKDGLASITLEAPSDKPWSETWRVECSRIWSCDFEGLAPVRTVTEGVYAPSWRPWPGESLQVEIRKPRGADGAAATVTRVDYRVSPGERRLKATLSMTMRASQGGWQRITLPGGAELQEVKINDQVRSIRPEEGGVVALPVVPGEQRFVLTWIQPWERGVNEGFPQVDLGSEAVNVTMTMELGPNRWLLWTMGPDWGPAVLFWSHVVLLIVLALLLGRLRQLPLKTYQWMLLLLGMSQLPLVAVLPIVAWFWLLVWRRERPIDNASLFGLFQLFLVGWTLITLGVIYAAVHFNLLMDVDMQVGGRDSSNTVLNWYVDRSAATLPDASVLSVPLFVWRAAMFVWVLWIVSSLVKWLPWAWQCFADGQLWKPLQTRPAKPPQEVAIVTERAPSPDGSLDESEDDSTDGDPQ